MWSPAVTRLALVVVVDSLYVVGVLLPYLTRNGISAGHWLPAPLGVATMLTVFFLPWTTFGSAAVSGYRLWRPDRQDSSRDVDICVVFLGAAGFLMYVSPWGVSALRWFLD